MRAIFLQPTKTLSLYGIQRFSFLIEAHFFFCELLTKTFYKMHTNINRQQSQASPCEICGGQSGTRRGFSTTVSVFLTLYHFTSAVHPISSTSCSYQRKKKNEDWELSKQLHSFGNLEALDRKELSL
jgi:hypothetical protein